jgi:hypothetical protein
LTDPPDDLPIRITSADLHTEKVEEWLKREEAIRAVPEEAAPQPPGPFAFLLNSVVYTTIAGFLGGFLGWAVLEPFFDDNEESAMQVVTGILFFPLIGMMIGGCVAAMEGLVSRNWRRALSHGAITLAISFGLSLAGGIVGGIFYGLGNWAVVAAFSLDPEAPDFRGASFFGQMVSRGLAWAVAGLCIGVAQGLAAKSKKVTANGVVGGLVGGLLGGLLFDPVDRLVMGEDWLSPERRQGAEISRCVGISIVGLLVGFFLGLVENLAKDAWLYMKAGPLRGKQFILYHDPTIIGSSPKSHVYLFKDPAVEPRHATISLYGNRHQVKDLGTPAGTAVNGRPVRSHVHAAGDRIQIGDTVLEYGQRLRA